jgi:FixJ family two-component response regulator
MTGQHDLELAIEAVRRGAADFLDKPVHAREPTETVGRPLANRRLARQVEADRSRRKPRLARSREKC